MIRPLGIVLILFAVSLVIDKDAIRRDLVLKERGKTADGSITSREPNAHGLVRYKFFVDDRWQTGQRTGSSWAQDLTKVTYDPLDPTVNTLGFYPSRARDTVIAALVESLVLASLAELWIRWRIRKATHGAST